MAQCCPKKNRSDVKKTYSNTRLDPFERADMVFDNVLVNNKTECVPNPRFKRINGYKLRTQKVRNGRDNSGYDITTTLNFDYLTNDFTNPIANEQNRHKCCPQTLFDMASN
jgi:hypothetical protein